MRIADRPYWLAWSRISGVGPTLLHRLEVQFESLATAWGASAAALEQVSGWGPKLSETALPQRDRIDPEQLYAQHLQSNPQFWTPADPDYPPSLRSQINRPPVLYYRGTPQPGEFTRPAISIVGTRSPTEHGKVWTRKIAGFLAERGIVVVSGMAAGIDGEAHRQCLQKNGRTWAVLGNATDYAYPPEHRTLHRQLEERGLILSEYPYGVGPSRTNFPQRNRIIAGLSQAVLILEAPVKSGALITARYARDYQIPVFILPNSPNVVQAQGGLAQVALGAQLILGEQQLLDALELNQSQNPNSSASTPAVAPQQFPLLSSPPTIEIPVHLKSVYAAFTQDPIALDALVEKTGLPIAEISGALLELELNGLIQQLPGMRYQRSNSPL